METKRFHDDDAVNQPLSIAEEKAALYRLAHGILTGKFDQNFAEWKSAQKIDDTVDEKLPDLSPIVEWILTEATTNGLLVLQRKWNDIMTVLLAELFGRYCEKDVRGMLPEGLTIGDLSQMRKDLIIVLDGVQNMAKSGVLPTVLADGKLLESLPSVGKRSKSGYWSFPDAPSADKDPVVKVSGTSNFRAHNTTVKLVVDGKLIDKAKLGEGVEEVFPGKTPQDVGRLFEGWHSDYCGEGDELPAKILARDDRKIWFTIVGE